MLKKQGLLVVGMVFSSLFFFIMILIIFFSVLLHLLLRKAFSIGIYLITKDEHNITVFMVGFFLWFVQVVAYIFIASCV
jgi:hypothetical protein